jgi:hypothetical protein
MSNPLDLINEIQRRGGTLFLAGDDLKYRGPRGAIPDELRGQLRACKPELKKILSAEAAHREGPPYPEGLGRVKCFYCVHCAVTGTKAVCQVTKSAMSGIALLRECPDFLMQVVH